MKCDKTIVLRYDSIKVMPKCVIPVINGFFKRFVNPVFLRGREADICSVSISNPLKNIRKINPNSDRKSNIRILSGEKESKRKCPAMYPKAISAITDGILPDLRSDSNTGAIQAIVSTTARGKRSKWNVMLRM
jgi:hypothetical protein